jgi:small-conductance mechanosensitive channel
MDLTFAQWPVVSRLIWTVVTIGVAYALGFVINAVVFRRLALLASRTQAAWDDVVVEELKRRIPFWSLLLGLWLSLGYWPIPPSWVWLGSKGIRVLAIGSVTLAAAAIATRLVNVVGPRATPKTPVPGLIRNIVRMVIFAVGLLIILNSLDVNVTPALAALGVGGLAVALAVQEPLSNLFAGVFITLAHQVRIGDYVRIESGAEGHIVDFNWHSTRIEAPSGNLIIVPNAKVSQAVITNFSLPSPDLAMTIEVTVGHESDMAKVERVTLDVAGEVMKEVPGGVPDFEPSVRFAEFTQLGIRFGVNLRAREQSDQLLVRHEFLKRLQARYAGEGITLARYVAVPNLKTVVDR